LTPRQIAAWAILGYGRTRNEMAQALYIAAVAGREKPEAIAKLLKEWNGG